MTLHSVLYDTILTRYSYVTIHSTYRGFYRISIRSLKTQKQLERLRPKIDYIILPDGTFLIGFTKDYKTLIKASQELTLEYLLEETKKLLKVKQTTLGMLQFYKDRESYMDIYPEEFI